MHVAIQGLGHVGFNLAEMLHQKGAKLTVSDLDAWKCNEAAHKVDATVVSVNNIFEVDCDIFAPCALGGSINKDTVEKLNCKILCGGANTQLSN